jgi:hypothetical protein
VRETVGLSDRERVRQIRPGTGGVARATGITQVENIIAWTNGSNVIWFRSAAEEEAREKHRQGKMKRLQDDRLNGQDELFSSSRKSINDLVIDFIANPIIRSAFVAGALKD